MKRNHFLMTVFAVIIAISSCSEKQSFIPNKGTVPVLDGKKALDTIPYTCNSCDSMLGDTSLFNAIVRRATVETRNKLNYPLSFVPVSMDIVISKLDTLVLYSTNSPIDSVLSIIVKYNYIAKNGLGNELEGETYSTFKTRGKAILDIDDDILLDSLKFKDKLLNRTLFLLNANNESLEILPTIDKQLIVKSSINCIDEGARISIILESGEFITKYSWNEFNCDGTSYFPQFTDAELELLSNSKLELIRFSSEDDIVCYPLNNEKDYFMQVARLLK